MHLLQNSVIVPFAVLYRHVNTFGPVDVFIIPW